MAPDERDLAVCRDPVVRVKLADEPERIVRTRPIALAREGTAAGLNNPSTGVERREREALLLCWQVERVGPGAAERIVCRRGV